MAELMKGHVWGERKDALDRKGNPIVTYPVMVEAKHDEIRVHVRVLSNPQPGLQPFVGVGPKYVEFLSYAGKPLANLDKFELAFLNISERTGITEFDMGFEANGNFNDSYRWVRSTKGLPPELVDAPVRWFIFGLPTVAIPLDAQHRERQVLAKAFQDWAGLDTHVPEVYWAWDELSVDAAYATFRSKGYEGAMVKQPKHLYERRRTDGWLKMKPENDATGVITGFVEAVCGIDQPELNLKAGDKLGRIGAVELTMPDGSVASPHGIPHELGRDMYLHPDKYLGESADFKFMERDRQGGYRHPVWGRLREATV